MKGTKLTPKVKLRNRPADRAALVGPAKMLQIDILFVTVFHSTHPPTVTALSWLGSGAPGKTQEVALEEAQEMGPGKIFAVHPGSAVSSSCAAGQAGGQASEPFFAVEKRRKRAKKRVFTRDENRQDALHKALHGKTPKMALS